MRGRGEASQARAASGRLITDLEMNSTYRGAVEVFNLCRNLDSHDARFAEYMRTFHSVSFDGRPWMFRLEATQTSQRFRDECLATYIPPTRKPSKRTDRRRADMFEISSLRENRSLKRPFRQLYSGISKKASKNHLNRILDGSIRRGSSDILGR